jgi:hypothetical protein
MKRDFRLPQHDDSPERAETLKSLRSVYKYRMDYGVPVTDRFRMEDASDREWQTKARYYQEMQQLNMRSTAASRSGSEPELSG